jgi:hypothetical protein
MKARLLFAVLLVLTVAVSASAERLESVLTQGGALYTLDSLDNRALVLIRRQGETRKATVVPGTSAESLDFDGRLLYDANSETLFVVWRREAAAGDEIVIKSLRDGSWSNEHIIAIATGDHHTGLRVTLTRMKEEGATLAFVHAVWWDKRGDESLVPRYGMVAYGDGAFLSTFEGSLIELAAFTGTNNNTGNAPEDSLPLLALTPAADAVDVVFGALDTPTATRVKLTPKRKKGDAKMWVPIGRSGGSMPHPKFASASNGNAQVMIIGQRVVVYSAGESFRFAIYDRGQWSPVRNIPLDDSISAQEVEAELRRSVAEDQEQADTVDQ